MGFSGCLYPLTTVKQEFRLSSFLWSILYQGIPLSFAQLFFSYGLTITKNFGIMTMIGFIGVVLGYLLKVLRYK